MFKERFLYEKIPGRPFCHAATAVQLPNGDLLAAFFSGQHEGAPDVAVLTARLKQGAEVWGDIRVTVDTPGRPYFNPVLFVNAVGTVRLFHMLLLQDSLNLDDGLMFGVKSNDNGYHWSSPPQPICTTRGCWLRNKPIRLKSQRLLLPCYYENQFRWMGFCLYSDDEGETWKQSGWIKGPVGVIQPTLLEKKDGSILALMRNNAPEDRPEQRRIWHSVSKDEGYSWSRCEPTELPNPNSGIDLVSLQNGNAVLAYNNSETKRTPLMLALSTDEGETWDKKRDVETDPENQYSYPAIIQSRDGKIHLFYSWKTERIKHVTVSEDWIAGAG